MQKDEHFYASLLNNSPVITYAITADGSNKVVYVSENIRQIFGFSVDECMNNPEFWVSHLHPDDKEQVFADYEKLFINGRHSHEYRFMVSDGSYIWIHDELVISKRDDGQADMIIGSWADITERKSFEVKLEEAINEAEKANQAKSTFLASMSHELRTPLHGIISFAAFGLEKTGEEEQKKLHQYFSLISDSSKRLKVLLDDLLDIAKLEAGKMILNFSNERVQDIIDTCVAEQTALINSNKLAISFNYPDEIPLVECDKNRIGQVVMNLLSNAIKFSPSNAKIDFTIEKGKAGDILVSISDEGIGIPENEIDTIFDKFVQSSQNKSIGGTGLGLAISRELVHAHKGKIWCENNEKGITFSFSLPLKQ